MNAVNSMHNDLSNPHSDVVALNSAERQHVEKMALEIQDLARRANEGVRVEAAISSAIVNAFDRFSKNNPLVCDAMIVDFSIVLNQLAFVMSSGQPAFRDAMRFARYEAVRLRKVVSLKNSLVA